MRSAVHLAHSSLLPRSKSEAESSSSPRPHHHHHRTKGLVLALGPYGATLKPGQEYAGIYPYPFGPKPYLNYPVTNYTDPHGSSSEQLLAEFHYDRLLIFALDKETWDKVDYIAFETIPLLREIRAVRKAIWMLRNRDSEKVQVEEKPFWVTSAFPGGLHPQMKGRGERAGVEEVLDAMVGDGDRLDRVLPIPDGVGVNCTNPSYLPDIVQKFTEAMARRDMGRRVGFVLYPDGGCTYDVVTRKWTEGEGDPESWAKSLAGVARGLAESRTWGEVIVGGCCKSGFEEIAALRKELDR
jgi:homocysteine S-methyltransferase